MRDLTLPEICFIACKYIGFGLLVARWVITGDAIGFFLMLFMLCMVLLRWLVPKLSYTVIVDVMACAIFFPFGMGLALFSAMYYRKYWTILGLGVFYMDLHMGAIGALAGLAGFFLGQWEKSRVRGFKGRDAQAERYYELEDLQTDLQTATAQVERMTVVSERARIAREIHDNAGHEIVAAYMSLQVARDGLDGADTSALELYDAALQRLEKGAEKIREAVHNLAPVTTLGVEAMRNICGDFPGAKVEFKSFGDTNHVPVHIWGVLEACINETLTNALRHAKPKIINVNLDATPKLVRLCVENHVVSKRRTTFGNGLRNLRYRAASVGGSLTIDQGEKYRVVCVIPIRSEVP
ncbi:MAG: histidine kinase [Defluviitaleaceae bacterium]|nr:histidine kinase [Defluviitaleaceae bacterium]